MDAWLAAFGVIKGWVDSQEKLAGKSQAVVSDSLDELDDDLPNTLLSGELDEMPEATTEEELFPFPSQLAMKAVINSKMKEFTLKNRNKFPVIFSVEIFLVFTVFLSIK